MVRQLIQLECDDCGAVIEVESPRGRYRHSGVERAFRRARGLGWAIARDRSTCYCQGCAGARRSVGRGGSEAFKAKMAGFREELTENPQK